MRLLLLLALALAWSLAELSQADAHAVLLEASPADSDVLIVAPKRVSLTFNEPVRAVFLRVIGADGRNLLHEDEVASADGRLEAPLPSLALGVYFVSYRVISADGHPVGGSLAFRVGEGEVPAIRPPSAATETLWLAASSCLRFAIYASVLLAAGGTVFWLFVAPDATAIDRGLARYVGQAAVAAALALILAIGIEGALARLVSPIDLFDWTTWRAGAIGPAGISAGISLVGLVLIGASLAIHRSIARLVGTVGASLAILGLGFTGHAATVPPSLLAAPAVVLHAGAAALWAGGLPPLLIVLRRLDREVAWQATCRFSTMAVIAVVLLVATGTVLAVLQLDEPRALWTTTYGLLLTGKLLAVTALLALAALNKWRLTPALRSERHAPSRLAGTIGVELALAAGVLGLTACLGATPPPRALAEQSLHEHAGHEASAAPGYRVAVPGGDYTALVEVEPARIGSNAITVYLAREADGTPLDAIEAHLELSRADAGIEPLRRPLQRVGEGTYRLQGVALALPGEWSVRVDALITEFQKATFETEIPIH